MTSSHTATKAKNRVSHCGKQDKRYAASGWVYSAIYESGGHPNDNRYYQIGFIPMTGFNVMGNLTLRF